MWTDPVFTHRTLCMPQVKIYSIVHVVAPCEWAHVLIWDKFTHGHTANRLSLLYWKSFPGNRFNFHNIRVFSQLILIDCVGNTHIKGFSWPVKCYHQSDSILFERESEEYKIGQHFRRTVRNWEHFLHPSLTTVVTTFTFSRHRFPSMTIDHFRSWTNDIFSRKVN